jgi:hypothetical protein
MPSLHWRLRRISLLGFLRKLKQQGLLRYRSYATTQRFIAIPYNIKVRMAHFVRLKFDAIPFT